MNLNQIWLKLRGVRKNIAKKSKLSNIEMLLNSWHKVIEFSNDYSSMMSEGKDLSFDTKGCPLDVAFHIRILAPKQMPWG